MDKIMKKGFLIAILIAIAGSVFAQTGTGWGQVRFKSNFKDSVNIANGWMIDGTVITPTAVEINHLTGVTSAIQTQINGKVNISDTLDMLDPYILDSEVQSDINDTITARLAGGTVGVALADSNKDRKSVV